MVLFLNWITWFGLICVGYGGYHLYRLVLVIAMWCFVAWLRMVVVVVASMFGNLLRGCLVCGVLVWVTCLFFWWVCLVCLVVSWIAFVDVLCTGLGWALWLLPYLAFVGCLICCDGFGCYFAVQLMVAAIALRCCLLCLCRLWPGCGFLLVAVFVY